MKGSTHTSTTSTLRQRTKTKCQKSHPERNLHQMQAGTFHPPHPSVVLRYHGDEPPYKYFHSSKTALKGPHSLSHAAGTTVLPRRKAAPSAFVFPVRALMSHPSLCSSTPTCCWEEGGLHFAVGLFLIAQHPLSSASPSLSPHPAQPQRAG